MDGAFGSYDPEAIKFLENLGHKMGLINGEKHLKCFLFQSIAILGSRYKKAMRPVF